MSSYDELLEQKLADAIEHAMRRTRQRRHCAFCGTPCWGYACRAHAYLMLIEKRARGETA